MPYKTDSPFLELFHLLLNHFGPQHWWPGETELEMMVGAVLTQNTQWKNVEMAIERLKDRDMMSLDALRDVPLAELADAIRPAGYYNVKAKRLKNLIFLLWTRYEGAFLGLIEDPLEQVRGELLNVKGIGPETADSILLYAFGRPIFVIDAYTYRILNRHGFTGSDVGYNELQEMVMDHLPDDPALFNELHALVVKTGKIYCLKRSPRCDSCPLKAWHSSPIIEFIDG